MFNHLTCLPTGYENKDCFLIMGDMHSRIGSESNVINSFDDDI